MESSRQIQLRTSSDNLPAINTPDALAQIRMDESRYPHYRNIPSQVRMEWLANQMKYLAAVTRIRDFDAREAILMATALDEMIMQDRYIPELTMPEFADAFKNGVFGNYGEFFGLSAPNLYGFLISFLESSKKKEATEIVLKSKKDAYLERTKVERERMQREIREEIEEAKRNGSFIPTGKVWFEPKKVDSAIDSSEHREKVRQQAREILSQIEK